MIVKKLLMLPASVCLFISCTAQAVSDSVVTILEKVIIEKEIQGYKISDPSLSLKMQTPLLQLPQNIQVISPKLIGDQLLTDMADAVSRNVSGASTSIHESWGNYVNLSMRGGRIVPFRNGMNVKMPWGPLTEDMCMIERIEFVKGPAGFMFANGDPAAIYNLVTKKPSGTNRGEVSFVTGSFDLYRTTFDLDGKLNKKGKVLYRFNMMAQDKKSHRQFDYNKRLTIAPVVTFKIDGKTKLSAEYNYQQMEMAMLGSANLFSLKMGDLPRNASMIETNLEPTFIYDHDLFVTFDRQISKDFKLTTKLNYLNYTQTGSSVWPSNSGGLNKNGDLLRSIANWDALSKCTSGQLYINGSKYTGKIIHRFLAGIDLSYKKYFSDFYQEDTITAYDHSGTSIPFNIYHPVHGRIPAPSLPVFDRTQSLRSRAFCTMGEKVNSLYIQDELLFLDARLRFTLAGRYTRLIQNSFGVYSHDKKVTPRMGISFNIHHAATVYVLYDCTFAGQPGIDSSSNSFKPLTGKSIEAGLKEDWLDNKLNTTIAVYNITRNNLITVVPGTLYKAVQDKQTRTQGIEFDMRGAIGKKMDVVMNYAFTKSLITRDADESKRGKEADGPAFPKHTGNAWINYEIKGKWHTSLGYQWQAKRGNGLEDYHRFDANVSYTIEMLSVSLSINNIMNKYLCAGAPFEFNNDPGSTEYYFQVEPGINFRFCVAYRF